MFTFGTRRHAVHPLTTNMDERGTAAPCPPGKQTKTRSCFSFPGLLEKLRPRSRTAKDFQLAEDLYLASTKEDPSVASGRTSARIPYRKQSIQPSKPAARSQSLKVPVAPKRLSLSPEVEARYLALKGTPVPVAPKGQALTSDVEKRFQALKALGLPPGVEARLQGRNLKKGRSSR